MIVNILGIIVILIAAGAIVEGMTSEKIMVGETPCKDVGGREFKDEMCEDYEYTDGIICSKFKMPVVCDDWMKNK